MLTDKYQKRLNIRCLMRLEMPGRKGEPWKAPQRREIFSRDGGRVKKLAMQILAGGMPCGWGEGLPDVFKKQTRDLRAGPERTKKQIEDGRRVMRSQTM